MSLPFPPDGELPRLSLNLNFLRLIAGANYLVWALGVLMTWAFLNSLHMPDGWAVVGFEVFTFVIVPFGLLFGALPAYLAYRRDRNLRWKRMIQITAFTVLAVALETFILFHRPFYGSC